MKRNTFSLFFWAALVALLSLAACAPLPPATPTAMPTSVAGEETATPTETLAPAAPDTATPTETLVPSAPDTATPTETLAPSAPDTATPAPTATSTPPPPTATNTDTPLPPTATTQPATATATTPAITDWRGEYFANPILQPPATVVRNDRVVDLDLASGRSPASGMPSENWSARWSRNWVFEEGNYRFNLLVDDGARLWVGNSLLVDAWQDGDDRVIVYRVKSDAPDG